MLCKAITTRTVFSRTTKVEIAIDAPITQVWQILVNFADYPSWNSTIIELNGKPEVGAKIELVSTLAPNKRFTLKVKDIQPQERFVWGNAMGQRRFSLESSDAENITLFTMTETIKGPLLPLFVKFIPSFDENFEQFATALKKRCESDN